MSTYKHTHTHTPLVILHAQHSKSMLDTCRHTETNARALIDLNTHTHSDRVWRWGGRGRGACEQTASHRNELSSSTIYITAHILLVKCKLWFLLFMFMKSKHQTKNARTHTHIPCCNTQTLYRFKQKPHQFHRVPYFNCETGKCVKVSHQLPKSDM